MRVVSTPCTMAAVITLLIVAGSPFAAAGERDATAPNSALADLRPCGDDTIERENSPWFFLLGFTNAHPKIQSEQLIDRYFNSTMGFLAPSYDDVLTVGDLRDRGILWVPYIGVGRVMSPRWAVFAQAGYAAGKVRTKADDPSILILPLHTDFEIKRGALYGGIGADFFPFGMPELREYDGVMERLRATKLNLGPRITWTNATYRAKVKVGFKPFDNLVDYEESDEWLLPSASANIGLDVPLTKRSQLSVNASYNRFFDERDDFEGPSYTIIWKRHFGTKKAERK